MTNRRFPPPWTVQRLPAGFKVIDAIARSPLTTVRMAGSAGTTSTLSNMGR